jgi:hypothetical protein
VSIQWRSAAGSDRPLLQRFECTAPAPRQSGRRASGHPKPYERDVQSAIRTLSVPVRGRDGTCLVGLDGGELVAVALWCRMDDVDYPLFKIRLIAVATSVRGRGGAVARECVDQVLGGIAAECEEGEVVTVYGLVDHRNSASQNLLKDCDFEEEPDAPVQDAKLATWALEMRVEAADA